MSNSVQHIINSTSYTPQTSHTSKVLTQLSLCRTAQMGYHTYRCNTNDCANTKYVYHSCRNRHCPQCGTFQQMQWLDDRRRELLPIAYYHVVFTIPAELNALVMGNRKPMFNLLFSASAKTLLQFAKTDGYMPGVISVLHTWGQQLSFHPHVHCIVSGGGIANNKWKNAPRLKDNFLHPVKAMAEVFKTLLLKGVKELAAEQKIKTAHCNIKQLLNCMYQKDWVVYAKAPFAGPEQVLAYLAGYTHKVAISNKRLVEVTKDTVSFKYKDYADNNKRKQLTLCKQEFVRRLEQHILPKYYCKIRSYGYCANRGRAKKLAIIKVSMQLPPTPPAAKIPWQIRLLLLTAHPYNYCECCKKNSLQLIANPQQQIDTS